MTDENTSTTKFRSLFVPVVAILSILLSLGLMGAIVSTSSADIKRNCATTLSFYNTFEKVIAAAGDPPSLAGKPVSPEQRTALQEYADNLRTGLPERPIC